MREFAQLVYGLSKSNNSQDKVNLLLEYFKGASNEDILWAVALLVGKRPKRALNQTHLRKWSAEYSGIPEWLILECDEIVGDKSETISLIVPEPKQSKKESLSYWIKHIENFADKAEGAKKEALFIAWDNLEQDEKYIFNKLLSATFRLNITPNVLVRALSKYTGIEVAVLMHKIAGKWEPGKTTYEELIIKTGPIGNESKPYPFYLAYPLDILPIEIGHTGEWIAEWKWGGIRAQIIKRNGQLFIWDKAEELITDKFPELEGLRNKLTDGCVIDGEILPFRDSTVLPSNVLQTRFSKKSLSVKMIKEAPVSFFAFDLLEYANKDIREKPLTERREILGDLIEGVNFKPFLQISPEIPFDDWEELASKRLQSRGKHSTGIVLKRKISTYKEGRQSGDWWKWKTDPLTIDGVLIYAAQGNGRHANLFTEYTFGVWNGNELVTFAKANSGLSHREIIELDQWIKQNMVEKFGPVRTVKPVQVFEIGFEDIQVSARHKSGIVLRSPHIIRWRRDKKPEDAGKLGGLRAKSKSGQC